MALAHTIFSTFHHYATQIEDMPKPGTERERAMIIKQHRSRTKHHSNDSSCGVLQDRVFPFRQSCRSYPVNA
ncbi:hypothetical protein FG05_35317 [Fusarium graminearum]|nr:hypothetical protein FG05_35317 [Fusarium graminearum]